MCFTVLQVLPQRDEMKGVLQQRDGVGGVLQQRDGVAHVRRVVCFVNGTDGGLWRTLRHTGPSITYGLRFIVCEVVSGHRVTTRGHVHTSAVTAEAACCLFVCNIQMVLLLWTE